VINGDTAFAPNFTQGFQCEVQADLAAELETVRYGLGDP